MIGFFDSGVGGITVLAEALRRIPDEDYVYYADTENIPYGTKTRDEVASYAGRAAEFMAGLSVDALVIACNTATSIAISDIRERYSFPILGMEPAVKPAVEISSGKRVLVVATPLTLKEKKYRQLVSRVDHDNLADPLPAPELVEFAENFVFDRAVITHYLRQKLKGFRIEQYGTVVLGCTHFPFFRDSFSEVFTPGTVIIDGGPGTVLNLKKTLTDKGLCSGKGAGRVSFYSSGKEEPSDCRYSSYLDLLCPKTAEQALL